MSNHPMDVPAPWTNTGEAYWFFLPNPAMLPESAYSPLESRSFFASQEAGVFRGGLGTVQVVRYTNSPAGPYDELAYIPGKFGAPGGKTTTRCTRIYVSTEKSVYNGRKNWNIPKHLARFSFIQLQFESGKASLQIEVFPPGPAETRPFFSAVATPSKWLPSFPLNTSYLPMDMSMTYLPLPSLSPDTYSMVGTDQWISILPHMKGRAEFVWYEPGGRGTGG